MWGQDLSRNLHIRENLLMHHLTALISAGWITRKRDGRHMLYSLRPKTFRDFPKILEETPFWREFNGKRNP